MLRARFLTDVAAAGLIVLSLAYFFTGGAAHEWIGLAAVLILIFHNALNRRWWKKPLAGTPDFLKAETLLVNVLLAASAGAVAVSGVMLSGEIFPFVPSGGGLFARRLHTASAFWLFCLSAFHAGAHAQFFSAAAKNLLSRGNAPRIGKTETPRKAKTARRFIVPAAASALAVCGIFSAARRALPRKLFAQETFDPFAFSDALPRFLFDYLCIAALFALAGFAARKFLAPARRAKK